MDKRKWLCTNTCTAKFRAKQRGGWRKCWIYVCQRHQFIAESSVRIQRGKRVLDDDQRSPVNELKILEGVMIGIKDRGERGIWSWLDV